MKKIIAVAVALAFTGAAFAQAPKAAPAPSTMEKMESKVEKAGAANTAATNDAKAKKKAEANARSAANKEARAKAKADRDAKAKAKKEAKAKKKADAAMKAPEAKK